MPQSQAEIPNIDNEKILDMAHLAFSDKCAELSWADIVPVDIWDYSWKLKWLLKTSVQSSIVVSC